MLSRPSWSAASTLSPDPATAAELRRAADRAALCSSSNASGRGLRGEYFAQEVGRGAPLLSRVDTTVDFDAALEWPANLEGRRPGAVRWSGWVRPPISGRYRFQFDQPGATVTVAKETLVDNGAEAGTGIELSAGRYYPITIEARNLFAMQRRLQLEWMTPYGAKYVVPRGLLFLPTETVSSELRP